MTTQPQKKPRPKLLHGRTERVITGCGNLYLTLNTDGEGKLFEVFTTLGKAGGCAVCQLEALTRSVTLGLRYGVPVEEYVRQLVNIKCPSPSIDENNPILSCADALAKIIARTFNLKEESSGKPAPQTTGADEQSPPHPEA